MYGYNAGPPMVIPIYTVLPYCVIYPCIHNAPFVMYWLRLFVAFFQEMYTEFSLWSGSSNVSIYQDPPSTVFFFVCYIHINYAIIILQVNEKICNLEREYRDCIKSRRDKIGITRHIMMHQVLYNVHVTLFIGQLHNI